MYRFIHFFPAGKNVRFRAKNSAIREFHALLRANQSARMINDLRVDVINVTTMTKFTNKFFCSSVGFMG